MRVILDTNVFVSGVFFAGPPYRILEAWRDGELQPKAGTSVQSELACNPGKKGKSWRAFQHDLSSLRGMNLWPRKMGKEAGWW